MENIDEHGGGHKKIIVFFVIGFSLLVIGGVFWYTVIRNTNQNNIASLIDTDGDLLSDVDEVRFGTDPKNIDTDSDGLSDNEEVRLNTDPKNAYSIISNVLDGEAAIDEQLKKDQSLLDSRILKLKTKQQ